MAELTPPEQPEAKPVVSAVSKPRALLRSSAVVSAATLTSRVLGLIRDVVLAALVGASGNADAFFVAFKIPNFLRRLFAEGAFAQAFVPVLSDTREREGHAAVKALIDRVAGALGGTLILLTGLILLGAPLVALLFAPGFAADAAKLALTAELIRITFPYLLLISLTGFAGGVLNSYGRFAVPAITPVLLNLCLIGAAVFVTPLFEEPVYGLAIGVLVAGFAQLLFQVPALAGLELLPRPRLDLKHHGVRRIMGLMVPALFGVSVSQINLLLDTVLASFLPSGSVSWLYYSDRLAELPLGVFAIAIATVILPSLSAEQAKSTDPQSRQRFSKTLDWALRMVLLIGLPAMVALMLLAQPILTTLFQYGQFSATDVAMSANSLRAYAFGLVAFMLIKVLAPGFYARQDMRTPVRIGIVAMVANMVLNPLLIFPLMWHYNQGHVGLALATSLSAFINAALLWRGLRRAEVLHMEPGWLAFAVQLMVACTAMAGVLMFIAPDAAWWFDADLGARVLQLAWLVIAGGISYLAVALIAGVRLRVLRGPI